MASGRKKTPSGKSPRLHIRERRTIEKELQNIALLQLDAAIHELKGNNASLEVIHRARTSIKKVRAVVQLAAPGLSTSNREHLMGLLCAAATRLSPLRDAEVQIQSLDLLERTDTSGSADLNSLRNGLVDIAKQNRMNTNRRMQRILDYLQKSQKSVTVWNLERIRGKDVERRIRRFYRRGRSSLDLCLASDDPEVFHLFRKQVKQLWYALRITNRFWPDKASNLIAQLGEIAETAGRERDLILLLSTIRHGPKNAQASRLTRLLEDQIPKLRKEALNSSVRFFEEKPKAFTAPLSM
jgi:CHAD domain-containing protein